VLQARPRSRVTREIIGEGPYLKKGRNDISTYRQRSSLLRVELKVGQQYQRGSKKHGHETNAHALRKAFVKRHVNDVSPSLCSNKFSLHHGCTYFEHSRQHTDPSVPSVKMQQRSGSNFQSVFGLNVGNTRAVAQRIETIPVHRQTILPTLYGI
jgi:hypothetical protein